VTFVGWFRPVKMMLYVPGTGGLAGPMTPVQGLPVAGLFMFKVQVSLMPGVPSVAVTVSEPFNVRYTAPVMTTTSLMGFTVTTTVAFAVRPDVELLAVTVNDNVFGAEPAGTEGAVKLC
jgi:hypothetical protein